MKITGAGYYLKSFQFQHLSTGGYEVVKDKCASLFEGWTEISRSEFDREWRRFVQRVTSLNTPEKKARAS